MVFLLFSSIWQRALQAEAQIGAARDHPGRFGGHEKTRRHSQAGLRNSFLRFSCIYLAPASCKSNRRWVNYTSIGHCKCRRSAKMMAPAASHQARE
jgi:hypothetical protein